MLRRTAKIIGIVCLVSAPKVLGQQASWFNSGTAVDDRVWANGNNWLTGSGVGLPGPTDELRIESNVAAGTNALHTVFRANVNAQQLEVGSIYVASPNWSGLGAWAVSNGTSGTKTLSLNAPVNVGGEQRLLTVTSSAASQTWLGGLSNATGVLTLRLNASGAFNIAANKTVAVTGRITTSSGSSAADLVKSGLGTLDMSRSLTDGSFGRHQFRDFTINEGTVRFGENQATSTPFDGPLGRGTVTLNGGTLAIGSLPGGVNSVNLRNPVVVTSPFSFLDATQTSGTNDHGMYFYGAMTLQSGHALIVNAPSPGRRQVVGLMCPITSTAGLVKDGDGILQLGGLDASTSTKTYSGDTFIRAGVLHLGFLGFHNVLPTPTVIRFGSDTTAGRLNLYWFDGNIAGYTSSSQAVAGIWSSDTSATRFDNRIVNTNTQVGTQTTNVVTATLTLNTPAGQTYSYSGTIENDIRVAKQGGGLQRLAGTLSHTGGLSASAGTLIVSGPLTGAFVGGMSVSSTGTFDLRTNFLMANGSLSFTGGTFATRGPLDLGGTARNIHVPATGTFYVGTGATSGTLVVGALTNTASGGAVVVEPGMTLSVSPAGTATFAGNTSGGGAITKAGAGTQSFTGTLAHSGGLRAAGGRTVFAAPVTASASGSVTTGYTGGTSVTQSGAVLELAGPLLHPTNVRPGGLPQGGLYIAPGGTLEVSPRPQNMDSELAIRVDLLLIDGNTATAGRVKLPPLERSAQDPLVIDVQALDIANDGASTKAYYGFLDLGNSNLIVRGGAANLGMYADMVRGWLATRGGGEAAMRGLGSRLPTTPPVEGDDSTLAYPYTSVAVVANTEGFGFPKFSTWHLQSVSAEDALVAYTWIGDCDLTGSLDGLDYNAVLNGWTNGLSGWENGDVDYNGLTDGNDFAALIAAYNGYNGLFSPPILARGWTPPEGWYLPEHFTFADAVAWGRARGMEYVPTAPSGVGSIPEPGSLALLTPVALLVGRRRR